MAEPWSDDRLEAALVALADSLDVPTWDDHAVASPRRRTRLVWLAVAAAVLVVVAVVAVAPARQTVARWFGVRVEQHDGVSGRGTFADDVRDIDLDAAIAMTGLDGAAFDATPLGQPTAAGIPPEGGVLLAWQTDGTTLWVRPGDDDIVVVKQLTGTSRATPVADVGDYAVLVDGDHVLDTPSRRVAAGRVLWWLADARQWRLESDLDATAMLAIARALAAS